jgi:chromosome segregation ATPase
MATATAAVTSKSEQASQLRAEAQPFENEVSQLTAKLEVAQRTLGALTDKRRKLAEDAAHGRQAKPGAVTTIEAEIAEAKIPVEGLTTLLAERQTRLDAIRGALANLETEIAEESARQKRIDDFEERFKVLEATGMGRARLVSDRLRQFIGLDLVQYDAIRATLHRELIALATPQGHPASDALELELAGRLRKLLHDMESEIWDGSFIRATRELLRAGWKERGDVRFEIVNLEPPR